YFNGAKVWSGVLANGSLDIGQNVSPIREIIFHGGAFDQAQDPYLEEVANLDGDTPTPGYVGVAYIILKAVSVSDISALAFEVERFPNVLGLASGTNKSGDDINVVSAIADIITSDWGGCGQDVSLIDTDNFLAIASKLAAEGNFCSLINGALASGIDLLRPLLNQARGVLFVNPEIGKYQLKLLRFPLDRSGALRLYDNDTISIDTLSKPSWGDVPSAIKVEYTERSYNYSTIPVVGKNLAGDE